MILMLFRKIVRHVFAFLSILNAVFVLSYQNPFIRIQNLARSFSRALISMGDLSYENLLGRFRYRRFFSTEYF